MIYVIRRFTEGIIPLRYKCTRGEAVLTAESEIAIYRKNIELDLAPS